MVSVIVPAHNEARVIGRLLGGLLDDAQPGELDVVVVSNGSTDDTAAVAGTFRDVRVLELAESSKHLALQVGDGAASGFPRLYVDADVELDLTSARELVAALSTDTVLAVAPDRTLDLMGSSWAVHAHYRVWERLPVVRDGLFGRGVVAVNELGHRRICDRPALLGDDLFVHTRFSPSERCIVPTANAIVRAPRTVRDLLRRRARAAHGNAELSERYDGATSTTSATVHDAVQLARRDPALWPSLMVFVFVTLAGRARGWRMRTAGATTWLRDESSRG